MVGYTQNVADLMHNKSSTIIITRVTAPPNTTSLKYEYLTICTIDGPNYCFAQEMTDGWLLSIYTCKLISLIYYSLSPVNIYYDNTNVLAILINNLHQGIMQKYKQ